MTDFFDRVSDRSAEMLSDHLADQARRAGLAGKTIEDSAEFCEQCEEPICDARREAYPGVQLCLSCKALQERRRYGG